MTGLSLLYGWTSTFMYLPTYTYLSAEQILHRFTTSTVSMKSDRFTSMFPFSIAVLNWISFLSVIPYLAQTISPSNRGHVTTFAEMIVRQIEHMFLSRWHMSHRL
jgi:hypothetical protein